MRVFSGRSDMHPWIRRTIIAAVVAAWLLAAGLGFSGLWAYGSAAGTPAQPPLKFPGDSGLQKASDRPTLILFIHPHCPCSRATLGELARLATICRGRLSIFVLMLHPANTSTNWEHTDLWESASAIPQVTVLSDEGGVESRRFGVATSGQALLYSAKGELLFTGGITESRGHSGDNAGRDAIVSFVLGTSATQPGKTSVYGCPLFNRAPAEALEGRPRCHP
jgi:hypothetical protein